jgi:hypothetical protein
MYTFGVYIIPDKAKPFVRKGRKATGLENKTAGLPKDDAFGLRGFCLLMHMNELTTEDTEKARKQRKKQAVCRTKNKHDMPQRAQRKAQIIVLLSDL